MPVTLQLTLSGNQVLTLPETNAPAGMLRIVDLKLMPVSYRALATQLAALREVLARLTSPA